VPCPSNHSIRAGPGEAGTVWLRRGPTMKSRIVTVVFAGPGPLNSVRAKAPLASALNV
jgi:hypothetical protein